MDDDEWLWSELVVAALEYELSAFIHPPVEVEVERMWRHSFVKYNYVKNFPAVLSEECLFVKLCSWT